MLSKKRNGIKNNTWNLIDYLIKCLQIRFETVLK